MNSEQKLPVSVCLIVKNEEKYLKNCLSSIAHFATEIVVNDTGSTDTSKEIARSFNVKLLESDWEDDFSAARNFCLQHATQEWVLFIDADETAEPDFAQKLRSYLYQSNDAYLVTLINHQSPSELLDTIPHRLVRLFRNNSAFYFEGRIHEQISPSIERTGGVIVASDLCIEHFGYQNNQKEKSERNMALLLLQSEEKPKDAFIWYQLGVTAYGRRYYADAKTYFYKAITFDTGDFSTEILFTMYTKLAQIAFIEKNYPRVEEFVNILFHIDIENPFPYYIRAALGFENQNYDYATQNLMKVKQYNKGLWHINPYQIEMDLGNAFYKMNQLEKAIDAYSETLKMYPESEVTCYNLGNCFYQLHMFPEAKEMYEWAIRYSPAFEAAKANLSIVNKQLGVV